MANEIKAINIDNTTYNIDYSPSTQYCLPLGGGTITGNLTVNGQLNTGNINGHTPITSGNIGSQTVSHALTSTDARYVVADNNAALPQYALLNSGLNRLDDSTGDTWIYYDALGGASAPWGIKHNQSDNYIEFYGSGVRSSFISLSDGLHQAKGFVNTNYNSAEYALTSNGGVAHIPSMSVNYANSAGTANSVAWDNVSSKPTLFTGNGNTGDVDLNDIKTNGSYYIALGATNSPGAYGQLLCMRNLDAMSQLYIPYHSTGSIQFRGGYDGGGYHEWTTVLDDKNWFNYAAPASHTHSKSQITDFPSALPASDVYAWAKKSSLEASDVPDLSGSYLSTNGGTLNGTLAINGYLNLKSHYIIANDNENAEWYVTDQGWRNAYTLIHSGNVGYQSVNYANSASSATYDSNWNHIANTYATKSEIPSIPSSLPANGGTADYATTAGSVAWGNVSGKPSFATVATSGSYNDLTDKPTIPTNTNQLTNGAGFITAASIPSSLPANGGNADYATRLGDSSGYYTKTTLDDALSGKQNTLVSGTNIKTINGESILGGGNINCGLKIYNITLEFGNDGESITVYLSQEQINSIIAADFVMVNNFVLLTKSGTNPIQLYGTTANYGEYLYFVHLFIDTSSRECTITVNTGYISQIHKKVITTTNSTMTLNPNKYYRNTNTSLSTLNITLSEMYDDIILSEYFVEFTTSSYGTTVSFPSTIKWANGEAPTFEASTTYQISIVNNLGIVAKFN